MATWRTGKAFLAIGVAISAIFVAASAANAAKKPTRGGTITLVSQSEPRSFNPAAMSNQSTIVAIGYNVYGALVYGDTKEGATQPLLLRSIEGSPDALVWTMKLRPNVRFTDGTPFDSAAIKYNFDYMANPANASLGASFASEVASWDVSNPLIAKATLKAPDGAWGTQMQHRGTLIASPSALQRFGPDYGTAPDKVVGAGPFVLSSWIKGSEMVFSRNPNYWDSGRPYVDQVTIKVIADPTAAFNTVRTGGADAMFTPSADIASQAKAANLRVLPYRFNAVSFRSIYLFNLQRPPFNDPLARKAIVVAVDPKKLAAAVGLPVVNNISDPQNPYFDPKAGALPKFDSKNAQQLIDQWSAKNGNRPLEFTVPSITGSTTGQNAEALQAVLSSYRNLNVKVQTVTSPLLQQLVRSGDFDLYPGAFGGSDPDIPFSSFFPTGASVNVGKYSNPAMDAALKAGIATTSLPARQKAYAEVQRLLMTDLPVWVMPYKTFTADTMIVSNSKLRDYTAGFATGLQTEFAWLEARK